MPPAQHGVLDRYLRHRRAWETVLWVALWMGLALSNSFTAWMLPRGLAIDDVLQFGGARRPTTTSGASVASDLQS